MKYVVEFGVRGGALTENLVVPSRFLASKLAQSLVGILMNDWNVLGAHHNDWDMPHSLWRRTWTTRTHFVAVSRLHGSDIARGRGPASPILWLAPDIDEGEAPVMEDVHK
jgi:hypothetical protein